MENKHIFFIDYVRALACVLVCLIHSPISSDLSNGLYVAGATLLGLPCNGLFFMVSGYLLLPINGDAKFFLKKRLSKVLYPTLFWTFFYVILNIALGYNSLGDLWHIVFSIPFARQGTGWLWFMYVLIGLYLVSPIISKWLESVSKGEFHLYLGLWVITCLYPILANYVEVMPGVENMLYYFCGYIGYFLLGAYLKKYPPKLSGWILIALYVAVLSVALLAKAADIRILADQFGDYLSVLAIGMCFSLFGMTERMEPFYERHGRFSAIVSNFSKCSFGIYLIHHFVNHQIIDRHYLIETFGCPLQIVMTAILTVLISYVIIYAISWLPFSEYIIGYHTKRNK